MLAALTDPASELGGRLTGVAKCRNLSARIGNRSGDGKTTCIEHGNDERRIGMLKRMVAFAVNEVFRAPSCWKARKSDASSVSPS